jgi:hypothetical protein
MHTGKAAPLGSFVQQRASADCVIAATATVTGNSYEKIAAAFGIPVDPKNGKPDVAILDRGVDILDTLFPLFALGVLATPLIAKEDPRMVGIERQSKLASSEQIKSAIKGHKAVLGYHDDDDEFGSQIGAGLSVGKATATLHGVATDDTALTLCGRFRGHNGHGAIFCARRICSE